VGRRAEAVPVSQEAVDLYGELTGLNRDAHLPGLAASLNNHAILLAQMGRRAEAVPVSQEAVDLRRELAGLNRDAHLPDYVQSVTALGYVLVAGTCPGEATGAPSRGVHAASSCPSTHKAFSVLLCTFSEAPMRKILPQWPRSSARSPIRTSRPGWPSRPIHWNDSLRS